MCGDPLPIVVGAPFFTDHVPHSLCSNPPVQGLALQYGSLPLLSHLLSLSEPEFVQRRALFALSALLRGNIAEQIRFIKVYRGLEILGVNFGKRTIQVQMKAVVLLTDILDAEVRTRYKSTDKGSYRSPRL